MKVSVLSANLGNYDQVVPWVEQVVHGASVEIHRFTDENFPGREKAMRPALKCALPKMFGFELVPGCDVYLWVDASRGLLRPDTAAWFIEALGKREMLLFLHPERQTIRDEYAFMKARMARPGETYLTSRYEGEWLDAQYAAVTPPWYLDNRLYASTAFAYRPTLRVREMLKDWWFHKSRYCIHDQLALPYVVRQHEVYVAERPENIYAFDHLPFTRRKGRAA